MTKDDLKLGEAALDAACKSIQDAMGVRDGMFASIYFSGPTGTTIERELGQYASAQRLDIEPED
jgi:hypothetical protein